MDVCLWGVCVVGVMCSKSLSSKWCVQGAGAGMMAHLDAHTFSRQCWREKHGLVHTRVLWIGLGDDM